MSKNNQQINYTLIEDLHKWSGKWDLNPRPTVNLLSLSFLSQHLMVSHKFGVHFHHQVFGTLGRIIFIHLLRSTVIEYLFVIIQFTSVLTSYSLHRFYRILLGHFTQNRRAIRLHHFPNWNSKNIHFILRNHDQLNSWRMNNLRYCKFPIV